MTKPVPRRPDAIQQQKPATQTGPPSGNEATKPPEPQTTLAPLSWEWRVVFSLWVAAFGCLLTYELFKMIQILVR